MKPSQDIKPITYMKKKSAELIDSVNQSQRPVIITQNGEAKAVVQDITTFERQKETLLMLKLLSQGITDADAGRVTPHDEFMKEIKKIL